MKKEINLKYVKSNWYKKNVVNGAIGGINTSGTGLTVDLYSDTAIPEPSSLEIDENGLATEHSPNGFEVQRELLFGMEIDINTAKALMVWLSGHISSLEQKQAK